MMRQIRHLKHWIPLNQNNSFNIRVKEVRNLKYGFLTSLIIFYKP